MATGEIVGGAETEPVESDSQGTGALLQEVLAMIGIPSELWSIVGIAIVGYIGNNVIVELGGKYVTVAWNLIIMLAAAYIGLDFVHEYLNKIVSVFGLTL